MAPTAVRKLRNGFAMAPTSQYLCWRQQNERKDLWIGAARARDDSTAAAPPGLRSDCREHGDAADTMRRALGTSTPIKLLYVGDSV